MTSGIRNSAKAIIIEDGKILFTKNKTENGLFYLLPGGGQEHDETLVEALKREWLDLDKLSSYKIYPKEILKYINSKGGFENRVYMGAMN